MPPVVCSGTSKAIFSLQTMVLVYVAHTIHRKSMCVHTHVHVEAQADIRCPPQSLFTVCVCVCMLPQGHVGSSVYRGKKKVLELQTVVRRQNMGDGNSTLTSERSASALNF